MRVRGLVQAAAVLLLAVTPTSRGDNEVKYPPKQGPTFAKEAAVTVPRYGEVWIPLRTIPRMDGPRCFEFVSRPSHGTISSPKIGPDGEWRVRYRSNARDDEASDSFSFRAQSPGRLKSEPALVSITVKCPPPLLRMEPSVIDFGEIPVGETARRVFSLRNDGGSEAVGSLLIPRGFRMPEGASFRIPPQGKASVALEFSPVQEGSYSEKLTAEPSLGSDPLLLKASARRRFSLVEISPMRWSVVNECPRDLRLWLSNSREWGLPGELTLRRGETRNLVLTPLGGTDDDVHRSTGIEITDGTLTLEIQPPALHSLQSVRPAKESQQELIRGVPGEEIPLAFSITNPDDFTRTVRWGFFSPMGGGTDRDHEEMLAPHETKNATYPWKPSIPCNGTVTLRITDRLASPVSLSWDAVISSAGSPDESAGAAVSSPSPIADAVQAGEPTAVGESPADSAVSPVQIQPLPNMAFRIKEGLLWGSTLEISYDRMPGAKSATMEELFPRVSRSASGEGTSSSSVNDKLDAGPGAAPITAFRAVTTPRREILMLDNPPPGLHSVRVSVWGGEGSVPLASGAIQVLVPNPQPFWKGWKFWCLALFLIAVWKIRRRKGNS